MIIRYYFLFFAGKQSQQIDIALESPIYDLRSLSVAQTLYNIRAWLRDRMGGRGGRGGGEIVSVRP